MHSAIIPQKLLTLAVIEQARRSGLKVWSDGNVATVCRQRPTAPGWYQIAIPVKTEPDAA